MSAWKYYEKEVLEKYPTSQHFLDKNTNNRAYLHIPVIEEDNQELIIERLDEYYNFIKDLVSGK